MARIVSVQTGVVRPLMVGERRVLSAIRADVTVPSDAIADEFRDAEGEARMFLRDVAGIVAAAQMGVVEFHIHGARRDRRTKMLLLIRGADSKPSPMP